ncbi:MAG: T9SS type A sorting domain-containing protein [Bacteroidetes bacterium]|nr:T9SS type A sorting domain-containing protein [Bacteroidota bacterium]
MHFTLYDALGKLIIDYGNLDSKQINLTVNLKEFKAGIYFLNVYGVKTQKAIKLQLSK